MDYQLDVRRLTRCACYYHHQKGQNRKTDYFLGHSPVAIKGKGLEAYQGLEHNAQMVAILEGREHPDYVVLAAGVCARQLLQNGHLCLTRLGHNVVGTDHLQSSRLHFTPETGASPVIHLLRQVQTLPSIVLVL